MGWTLPPVAPVLHYLKSLPGRGEQLSAQFTNPQQGSTNLTVFYLSYNHLNYGHIDLIDNGYLDQKILFSWDKEAHLPLCVSVCVSVYVYQNCFSNVILLSLLAMLLQMLLALLLEMLIARVPPSPLWKRRGYIVSRVVPHLRGERG